SSPYHHHPTLTGFPYTTLFRSRSCPGGGDRRMRRWTTMTIVDRYLLRHTIATTWRGFFWFAGLLLAVSVVMAVRKIVVNALPIRSEEHTSELQSLRHLVCRLLL